MKINPLSEKKYANRFLISSQRHNMRLTISKMRKIVVMTRISVTLFVQQRATLSYSWVMMTCLCQVLLISSLIFAKEHSDCGYILRSYRNNFANGDHEDFRYYSEDRVFPPCKETYIDLFGKSVFVSGFTIRRDCALEFESEKI